MITPVLGDVREVVVEVNELQVSLLSVVHIILEHVLSVTAFGAHAEDLLLRK